MLEYKIRAAGLTHDQNFAGSEGLLNAFGKWKPEDASGRLCYDVGATLMEARRARVPDDTRRA
jgi:hypothetical protein